MVQPHCGCRNVVIYMHGFFVGYFDAFIIYKFGDVRSKNIKKCFFYAIKFLDEIYKYWSTPMYDIYLHNIMAYNIHNKITCIPTPCYGNNAFRYVVFTTD